MSKPAKWALDRANALMEFPSTGSQINVAVENVARYIEQHEKPPVDPDVLAVREILSAWEYEEDDDFYRHAMLLGGDRDRSPAFHRALIAYRKHKP